MLAYHTDLYIGESSFQYLRQLFRLLAELFSLFFHLSLFSLSTSCVACDRLRRLRSFESAEADPGTRGPSQTPRVSEISTQQQL